MRIADQQKLLDRLAAIGPDDSRDLKLKKRVQVSMAYASIPVLLLVAFILLTLNRPVAALFPVGYLVGTALLLAQLFYLKHYLFFREAHTALVLFLPFGLHWHLGGFVASGGWLLWCMVPVAAVVMFVGEKRSVYWFIALQLLILIAGLREGFSPAPKERHLPTGISSFFFIFNTMGVSTFMFLSMRTYYERLEEERARSERLLLNILPGEIADRLKSGEEPIADQFDEVTVLFSDIVGFTALSQRFSPSELVRMLNEIFRRFDNLSEKYGVEKVKTIGDAYMVVGGLPTPRKDHAEAAALMALDIVKEVERFSSEKNYNLSMRIGLHSGVVVAGVIGTRKFAYDLWGDTVNTASRMESHGAPERIHISAQTAELLKNRFLIEERGEIEVKGKGPQITYWLISSLPEVGA